VHPSAEQIQKKHELGYNFLALGADFIFLAEAAKNALREAEKRK
jgi:2-keto-3-deoxy-L-rhamnonate aldolase RhmA